MLPQGQFWIEHVRPLGEGGLGVVDEVVITASNCEHPVGARFARKRLNAKFKERPEAQARFDREIDALRSMSHPKIVAFKGQHLPGGERYYIMPLYARSLRDFLRVTPAGEAWRNVAAFGATLADAMQHAHLLGYVHRDLKPENILLDLANNPVISDWGLGYFVHRDSKVLDLTRGGMGTEYYCSLEQWTTGKCEGTGDIYSLGVVLAELVRGVNRIAVLPGMGISGDAVPANAGGSKQFNDYIRIMTAIFPIHRPQSMAEVSATLVHLARAAQAA